MRVEEKEEEREYNGSSIGICKKKRGRGIESFIAYSSNRRKEDKRREKREDEKRRQVKCESRKMSSSSSRNRNPKLKRRTPSPPPPPPRRRERGEKSSSSKRQIDSASAPRYTAYPTTLLVRNLSQNTRPEDLHIPFESFGPVNDVYLPKNYHTRKPAGYGFVKYRNAEDAAEAKHHMNNHTICEHQISVVFSKEDAKRPEQMLAKEHNT